MGFNGAGVFQRVRNWVADATAGVKIRADYHDSEDDNFALGISNCIARDGQSIITQNIPWNSKRITGLADPVAAQDAATKAYADTKLPLTGGGSITGDLTVSGNVNGNTGTFNGAVTVGGTLNVAGDMWAQNGIIRFGNSVAHYLYYDGTTFNLAGGPLSVSGGISCTSISAGAGNVSGGSASISGQISGGSLYISGTINAASYGAVVCSSLTSAGNVTADAGVYSLAGAVVSRQLGSGGNFGFYLQNPSGGYLGAFIYNAVQASVDIYNMAGGQPISLANTGKVKLGNGWVCKAAYSGGYGPNVMNANWLGDTSLQWYIDDTAIGAIPCDYRIKKNVMPLPGMWDAVKGLKPIMYSQRRFSPPSHLEREKELGPLFINSDVERWGFLAHELQDTLTKSAADGVKDDPAAIQSLNPVVVIAALTRALQEAMERIEALEGRA